MTSYKDVFLAHAERQPYDPAARRERYLLERRLKGKTPASGNNIEESPTRGGASSSPPRSSGAVTTLESGKSTAPGTPITPKRVAEMKVRLEALRELLTKLTAEANKKAGVESPKSAAEKKADAEPSEKKTAAEKKEAAKAAEKSRDKAGGDSKTSSTVKSLQSQLNDVHDKIEAMRERIAAANRAAAKRAPAKKDPKVPKALTGISANGGRKPHPAVVKSS